MPYYLIERDTGLKRGPQRHRKWFDDDNAASLWPDVEFDAKADIARRCRVDPLRGCAVYAPLDDDAPGIDVLEYDGRRWAMLASVTALASTA